MTQTANELALQNLYMQYAMYAGQYANSPYFNREAIVESFRQTAIRYGYLPEEVTAAEAAFDEVVGRFSGDTPEAAATNAMISAVVDSGMKYLSDAQQKAFYDSFYAKIEMGMALGKNIGDSVADALTEISPSAMSIGMVKGALHSYMAFNVAMQVAVVATSSTPGTEIVKLPYTLTAGGLGAAAGIGIMGAFGVATAGIGPATIGFAAFLSTAAAFLTDQYLDKNLSKVPYLESLGKTADEIINELIDDSFKQVSDFLERTEDFLQGFDQFWDNFSSGFDFFDGGDSQGDGSQGGGAPSSGGMGGTGSAAGGDGPANGADGTGANATGGMTPPSASPPSGPMRQASQNMKQSQDYFSPLVLDLDGDGVEVSAYNEPTSAAYFDLDEDGFAEQTAWVSKDDGLLAYDRNHDGIINDISELFGSATVDGFTELRELDANGDGIIDGSDPIFNKLVIWQDTNEDGRTQDGELHQLSEFGIISINANATPVSGTLNGNLVTHTSSYTYDIGGGETTRDIIDVWFQADNLNTIYNGDDEIDFDALTLPTSRGYGILPGLYIAISQDDEGTGNLKSLMQDLADKDFDEIFSADNVALSSVRDILYRWAGVDTVDPNSRGKYVDARDLEFLEAVTGEDFLQRGYEPNPRGPQAGGAIQEAFHEVLNSFYGKILAQAAGGELFLGVVTYDFATDSIVGISGLDAGKLSDLETEATGLSNTSFRTVFWQNVVRMIEYTVGVENLSPEDSEALDDAIQNSDISLDLEVILDGVAYISPYGADIDGTSGNDTLNGTGEAQEIFGLAGNDTLNGGAEDDYLVGGADSDVYLYAQGDGEDVIFDTDGTGDYIEFGAGIDLVDLTITRLGNSDLNIAIDNGVYTGNILIADHFEGDSIEELRFSSLATYDLMSQNWTLTGTASSEVLKGVEIGTGKEDVIYGEGGNDTLYGFSNNDTLYGGDGDDTLIGEMGDDTLYGDSGNDILNGGDDDDVYYFTSGHDVIYDSEGTDKIVLPDGFDSINVIYQRFGNDLRIVLDEGNTIYIKNQYLTGQDIEGLEFYDTTFVTLSSVTLAVTEGTSGNNSVSLSNGSDQYYALEGDDTVIGFSGNDEIYGGEGDDYLLGFDGDDFLYGDEGSDRLSGGTGNDALFGGSGNDSLTGSAGNDTLNGGSGNDIMQGGADDDTYHYTSGHDTLSEIGGQDRLVLAAGRDFEDISFRRYSAVSSQALFLEFDDYNTVVISSQFISGDVIETLVFSDDTSIDFEDISVATYGDLDDNYIAGSDGTVSIDDTIYALAGNDSINSGDGHDTIYGGEGDDEINGADGNDTLYGGAGDDTLYGGSGDDIYIYETGLDLIDEGSGGTDTVIMSGVDANDVSVSVDGLDATLIVNTGTNELRIDDQFSGVSDRHIERVQFSDGFTTNLERIDEWQFGTLSADLLSGTNFAETILAKDGDDIVNANDGNDDVHGGNGADTISGGSGNDVLYGGGDDDTLSGNAGNDTLQGGTGFDTASYASAGSGIVVNLHDEEAVNDGDGSSDTILFVENVVGSDYADEITGSIYTNSLFGGTGDDTLDGLSGDDFLDGGSGTDTLIGGSGNDTYIVDNASDVVIEAAGGGYDDTVQSNVSYILSGNVENLTLLGVANLNATGNDAANLIIGNVGNNTLDGGTGADSLVGGTGDDVYIVDNEFDYVLEAEAEGHDVVYASASYLLGEHIEDIVLTGAGDLNAAGNILNNKLVGNAGINTLAGGVGDDTYVVDSYDTIVEEDGEGTDTVQTDITYSLGDYVENLFLTGSENVDGTGNSLDNVLFGNSANNTLNGGSGADTLEGGDGLDVLIGGLGDDVYIVDTQTDSVIEFDGEGIDTILSSVSFTLESISYVENLALTGLSDSDAIGNSAVNTLIGNNGNNTLDGGAGADSLIGGLGDDTYIVDDVGDVVTEGASEGNDTVQTNLTYTLGSNIENLILTGASTVNGTGNALDNVITGNEAANILTGNDGNDTLDGSAGADSLIGGLGDDTYIIDDVGDVVTEDFGAGTDTIQSNIAYTLGDYVENLMLLGETSIDGTGNSLGNVMLGNSGNNTLDGGVGADTMSGGAGDDVYLVDDINDLVTEEASAGEDTVRASVSYALSTNVENLILNGSAHINAIGNSAVNTLTGNSGNNTLDGGAGADSLIGGLGDDTYIIDDVSDVVTEGTSEGNDTVLSSVSYSLVSDVENLTLTGGGDIQAIGNGSDNILTGNSGHNSLDGLGGTDTLIGGQGDDVYLVDSTSDTIIENASEGSDTVVSSVTFSLSTIANVENILLTGTASLSATGNALDNYIVGNSGVNVLTGDNGNDTLDGGAGADTMIGGAGDDIFFVDNSGDVTTESSGEGIDTIQSSITRTLSANIENLILVGENNINGTGNSLVNVLMGNSGNNSLNGGSGADTLIGGVGNDTYTVDNINDVVIEDTDEGIDRVIASVSFTLASNIENLSLGSGAINGTGNALDNSLQGGSGVNILSGGEGNDTLNGGSGADTLIGGWSTPNLESMQ